MAQHDMSLREQLQNYKLEFEVLRRKDCTAEEIEEYQKLLEEGKPLPDGIYRGLDLTNAATLYTVEESGLSADELREYLTYRQLKLLKTIKNCVVFFAVLTVIGLALSILNLIA